MRKKVKKQLELMLRQLKQPFDFLGWKFKVSHEDKWDVIQDLNKMVIERFEGNQDKGIGWWFKAAVWVCKNRLEKAKTEPINLSISIDSFFSKNVES